jgi:Domain of unknown function (DUF4926)
MPIQDYEVVALTEDCSALHKLTYQPITLKRGQVGTVVMTLDPNAYLVDFADSQGATYAMETIPTHKLLRLLQELEAIPA